MDKCREEFEKQKYWIGLFRDAVDFDEELGRYVLNGQRKLYAFHLDSFNEKWAIWQEAWQRQQAKVEEANAKAQMCRDEKNHAINRWSAVCKERDELQKQIDALEKSYFVLARIKSIASKNLLESILIKEVRQALKGEQQ